MELDFLYPSEGIHRRWDNGYRITSTAATWDQAAFVLSVLRRKLADETQETLRTSAFPSSHVKVNTTASEFAEFDSFLVWNAYIWDIIYAGKMVKKSLYCINMLWENNFMNWEVLRFQLTFDFLHQSFCS